MTIVLIPLANGAIDLADYMRNRTPSSCSLRFREQSYPSNDEEQYFPSTRNAPESNGERWSGPVMRGEKRGKNPTRVDNCSCRHATPFESTAPRLACSRLKNPP